MQQAYEGKAALPAAAPADLVDLLAEIGRKRELLEIARGGISLNLPEQSVEQTAHGYRLTFREVLRIEDWNAQISLLTGMAAAQLMLEAGVGLLRTLPPARPQDLQALRRVATMMDLSWPKAQSYADFVRELRPSDPAELGFLNAAVVLFRGAGYLALSEQPASAAGSGYIQCLAGGGREGVAPDSASAVAGAVQAATATPPTLAVCEPGCTSGSESAVTGSRAAAASGSRTAAVTARSFDTKYQHAAVAAPYAHVTAPLRRLADRYALEACRCICAGEEVPAWVRDALPLLPREMSRGVSTASQLQSRAISAIESLVLAGREGERFVGVAVDVKHHENAPDSGTFILRTPAIQTAITGENLPSGESILAKLVTANSAKGRAEFQFLRTL